MSDQSEAKTPIGASTKAPVVVKVGGHDIGDMEFLAQLAAIIRDFPDPVVIVHGGGKEISALQQSLGIEPRYIDGVRVTDAPSLDIVQMVLCGLVNKRVVGMMVNAGVDAIGLSGVDRGIVRASQMQHPTEDMGFTGSVGAVRGEALTALLDAGLTPIMAPLCLGADRDVIYNVNADHVAGAVAAGIGARRIVFLTNVAGVLINDQPVETLTTAQAEAYIEDGTIFGGMIPKVKTALGVLDAGVPQAVITNLDGLKSDGGTVFVPEATSPTVKSNG